MRLVNGVDSMKKLNEQTWNDNILSRASLITDGSNFMRTYDLNNGEILKILKKEEELGSAFQLGQIDDFTLELMKKIKLSKEISEPSIVLPKTVYYGKSGGLVGYTTPKIGDGDLDDYLRSVNSLEIYNKVFSILINKVRLLNNEGIILPDLGNTTNILYNPKNDSIHFIDFDGLQIQDTESFSLASILHSNSNPMLFSDKYSNGNLFTSNLDKLTLLVLYIYYTTGMNIMHNLDPMLSLMQFMNERFNNDKTGVITPRIESFIQGFTDIGILGTEIAELIRRVFDQTETNIYPDYAIKELALTHNLSSEENEYGLRYFIKK